MDEVVSKCQSGDAHAAIVTLGGLSLTAVSFSVKPVLTWDNVCSPNLLRTDRRTMIRFLIELLVRRTWFGQFDELYFVLNWLVLDASFGPNLRQTRSRQHDRKCRLKSSQVNIL